MFHAAMGEFCRLRGEAIASFREVARVASKPTAAPDHWETIIDETLVLARKLKTSLATTLVETASRQDPSKATTLWLRNYLKQIEWNIVQAGRAPLGFEEDLRYMVSEPVSQAMLFLRCVQDADQGFHESTGIAKQIHGRENIVELYKSRVTDEDWERSLDADAPFVESKHLKRIREIAMRIETAKGYRYVTPLPYTGFRVDR